MSMEKHWQEKAEKAEAENLELHRKIGDLRSVCKRLALELSKVEPKPEILFSIKAFLDAT